MFTTKAKELTLNTITSDWAPLLESTSRKTGAVLALLFTLGFVCGRLIHDWNDELTGFVVTLLGLKASAWFKGKETASEAAPTTKPARQTAEPAPAVVTREVQKAGTAALDLRRLEESLKWRELRRTPVVKLRKIARAHGMSAKEARVARKAQLVDFLTPLV